uniref:Clathrin light chain n=1 Tax=Globodera pallida TaxID=36090 RepID=A0A183CDL7_GLOPA
MSDLLQAHINEEHTTIAGAQQQQRVVEENTQHVNNNVLDLSASFLNNDGEPQFATPVPPVSAPRCDDGDPQPLFDFFGGATGADQSDIVSFDFGSFFNFGGPSANKGQQQLQGDAPGGSGSQNEFNFNVFLEKPNDSNKDGTGDAF